MKLHPILKSAAVLALAALAACNKAESTAAPLKTPAANAAPEKAAPPPIVVDEKAMQDATKRVDDAASEAAAKLKSAVDAVTKDVVKKPLRFSGIPNQNTTELEAKYKPLAGYLTTKLGVPVEYVPSADYNASVDAFKNGDLLLCWFGGYTGVQARAAVSGARAIACGPRDMKFRSYFVANKNAGLKHGLDFPMALKGKKFTFGSASSTSGRLMPEYFIRRETKLSPKDFFGAEPSFTKGHDQTLELVAAGTFDAGVVDYTVYDKRVKEKKVDPELVQVIWESPEFFDYQFTAHPALDTTYGPGFTDRLQAVLVSMKGADLELLSAMDRQEGGLIACKNEDFETLRKLAVEIGLLR
ncbi:MAG: putative selenate ABC transporter substrate-binding protein [Planctomycetota bacterium]|nr:putative selenate ABC transporter substrate-binding protein [Planctomycetota bacterium]